MDATALASSLNALRKTPLHGLHERLGARMTSFAGYAMPLQYPSGILAEHSWTRTSASLFDVSHMGQALLVGPDHATTAAALEVLVPGDVLGLAPGRQRYTLLTADDGGVLDDLIVGRPAFGSMDGALVLVVNAARKADDWAHIAARLPPTVRLETLDGFALIALQGPRAVEIVARRAPEVAHLRFMERGAARYAGVDIFPSRSGYTGEDGLEISVSAAHALTVADALLDEPEVKPAGLGARDSLRLEAGLRLYGHDMDASTSPVEAGLAWSIPKRRRSEGGFPGEDRILRELREGPSRRCVGLKPSGRAPAREGCEVSDQAGTTIGWVTSGGFGPTVGGPVALAYLAAAHTAPGTQVSLLVRGRAEPATVVPLPFTPHRYVHG